MKKRGNINLYDQKEQDIQELVNAFSRLDNPLDIYDFLKDLCTPQELSAMADRWKVCKLLDKGDLSYREISEKTGVSLATIVRVARFLHDEPHHGYETALRKLENK